jgi:phage FluMu gp28-like protein
LYRTIRYTSLANPYFTMDEWKQNQGDYTPDEFKQLYEAEWTNAGGQVFENVDNCIINQAVLLSLKNGVPMIVEEPKPGLQYVAGLDIAQKADYMAMIICEKVSGRLVAIFRVNKRTYTFAEAQVARLCLMYHPRMYGDVTGMGLASWEHTKEIVKEAYKDAEEAGEAFPTYTTFRPVELQTEERRDVIDRLALNLISERFRFPNIKQLVTELRQFEKTVSPSGKVKMSAPQGLHDDLVFAAALANQGLPRIKYTSSNTNMTRRQAGWEKL